VHITDGFLWRRLKGRQTSHAKRRHNSITYKQPGAKQLLSPQVCKAFWVGVDVLSRVQR
jgi:hypothetical protein